MKKKHFRKMLILFVLILYLIMINPFILGWIYTLKPEVILKLDDAYRYSEDTYRRIWFIHTGNMRIKRSYEYPLKVIFKTYSTDPFPDSKNDGIIHPIKHNYMLQVVASSIVEEERIKRRFFPFYRLNCWMSITQTPISIVNCYIDHLNYETLSKELFNKKLDSLSFSEFVYVHLHTRLHESLVDDYYRNVIKKTEENYNNHYLIQVP